MVPDTDILLKFLLAHLVGDFLLQPKNWIKDKALHRHTSAALYLHGLTHSILIILLVWDFLFWPYSLAIGLSHIVIDGIRSWQPVKWQRLWFLLDQLLHVTVIVGLWSYHQRELLEFDSLIVDVSWLKVTAIVFVSWPAGYIIKELITNLAPHGNDGLPRAGMHIGVIERLLVLLFVIQGQWEAVGFLLAAKSVFRFGDLRDKKEKHQTEYFLIGTLLSFGVAILSGTVVLWLDL